MAAYISMTRKVQTTPVIVDDLALCSHRPFLADRRLMRQPLCVPE